MTVHVQIACSHHELRATPVHGVDSSFALRAITRPYATNRHASSLGDTPLPTLVANPEAARTP